MTNEDVSLALLRLNDALCSLERNAGGSHTLVLVPHDGRAPILASLDGKPINAFGLIEDGCCNDDDAAETVFHNAMLERGAGDESGPTEPRIDAIEHLSGTTSPCRLESDTDRANVRALLRRATRFVCLKCKLVLKDRNGPRGGYDTSGGDGQ